MPFAAPAPAFASRQRLGQWGVACGALLGLLALSACMGTAHLPPPGTVPPTFSPPPTNMDDPCGALPLAPLAGQHFSALADIPLRGALRVLHPLQPVTMDFSPTRLNARVDAHGLIRKLTCG